MQPSELLKEIERAIDDLGAVASDLKDVVDGEIDLDEVNDVYLHLAETRCVRVKQAIQRAEAVVAA